MIKIPNDKMSDNSAKLGISEFKEYVQLKKCISPGAKFYKSGDEAESIEDLVKVFTTLVLKVVMKKDTDSSDERQNIISYCLRKICNDERYPGDFRDSLLNSINTAIEDREPITHYESLVNQDDYEVKLKKIMSYSGFCC